MIYYWHQPIWQNLLARSARLPHALLLRGIVGIGKQDFAIALSQRLLCQQAAAEQACGHCTSCHWFAEGAHPDFRWLKPEEEEGDEEAGKKAKKKSIISVAQIRQLADFVGLSSHQTGLKLILISPADTLNRESSNALLKMLEEPPPNTHFILVTSYADKLLPTILSRCQALTLPPPSNAEALTWLQTQGVADAQHCLAEAGGAPLLALEMRELRTEKQALLRYLSQGQKLDAAQVAPHFLSLGMPNALQTLQKWVYDLLSVKLAQSIRYHLAQQGAMQVLSKSVNLQRLLQYQDKLIEAQKTANHPLSNEMQLEHLLLQYAQMFRP